MSAVPADSLLLLNLLRWQTHATLQHSRNANHVSQDGFGAIQVATLKFASTAILLLNIIDSVVMDTPEH